jgi:hypothetical protein
MTPYTTIQTAFHAMPQVASVILEDLEYQYFLESLGDYELEVGTLRYDDTNKQFATDLPQYVINTLANGMYAKYLRRDLDWTRKMSGIVGKDISITGGDTTKRVTQQSLQDERNRVDELYHKQKTHCFN